MFELSLNLSDPSKNSFYFPILIAFTTILFILKLIINLLKNCKSEPNLDINDSLDKTLEVNIRYSTVLGRRIKSLQLRYLIAYLITRAAIWAKTPYLYHLIMTVQEVSFADKGYMFFINIVFALIFIPLTKQFADKKGRRFVCRFYNYRIIFYLVLLMRGSNLQSSIAYIIPCFDAEIISTIFEDWFISESEKEFERYKKERERFQKNLFVKSKVYDSIIGIITSIICAFIYSYFGINAPFIFSIILSSSASIVIPILWDENGLYIEQAEDLKTQLRNAMKEFKKMEVLFVGLIEGLAKACFYIYIFSLYPILKQSTPGDMNTGFIVILMVLTIIIGNKLYELLIVYLHFDYYISITGCLFFQGVLLFSVYYVDGFLARIIFLALLNGFNVFYNALNSLVKSNILEEKQRTLMNLFRIPTIIFVIIVLLILNYIDAFSLALIAGTMSFVASFIGILLFIYLICFKEKKLLNRNDTDILKKEKKMK